MSSTKKKIIILLDTEATSGWGFTSALQESYEVDCINKISNTPEYHKGLGNIRRQLCYLTLAIKAIFCCKRYDAVIAWQQFFGIYMGAIMRFLHLGIKCPIIIMTFIYKPRTGFKGKLYQRFVKYALSAKQVKRVTVYSQSEVNHYSKLLGLPQERFTALHLGIDDTPVETTKGDFIFSTGRSLRDYDFLCNASPENFPVVIAADNYYPKIDKKHITVLRDCFGDAMLHRMAECFCVVVPLKDTETSSGQLVILQAMMLGKPVIVTENKTARFYLEDNQTGFIIDKTQAALQNALKILSEDREKYNEISQNARNEFSEKFTTYRLGKDVSSLIDDILFDSQSDNK